MEAIIEISKPIARFWDAGGRGDLKLKESFSSHCELTFLVLCVECALEYRLLKMIVWDGEK